ncbi:MAG TPA: glycosyltransferase family 4 protein [Acidimicrobiales bacterium]|nr:glycosyltransferase family 4 protein [Acidimicrobiales bacterium]
MISALHQLVPAAEQGAVTAHALEVRILLREMGISSHILSDHIRPEYADVATFYGELGKPQRGQALLYHHAIGSWVGVFVEQRPEPLLVDYHNVTPPGLFARWSPDTEHGLQWGLEQLEKLAPRTATAFAHSSFSVADLGAFRRTEVVPVLVDVEAAEPDEQALAALQADGPTWLFVGRVAPHKAQHDLVRALAVYRSLYDRRARLFLVGSSASDAYTGMLLRLADDLGIGGAVRVTGAVSAPVLAAHYRAADVFVCLSDHEGFCVPLLEAMHHDVPVVAYAAAAVPETAGDAALLLSSKDPAVVAAAVHRVVTDRAVHDGLVAAGRRRREDFALPVARERYRAALERALEAM